MKVGVCIKSTPDADTRLKIAAGGTGLEFNPDGDFIHVRELIHA